MVLPGIAHYGVAVVSASTQLTTYADGDDLRRPQIHS